MPAMGRGAVFEQVDALPGAQAELAMINGDTQAGVRQHGAHMRGGVVGSLQGMANPCLAFGDQVLQKSLQVFPGGRIVVFTDHQGGAGMRHVKKTHALLNTPLMNAILDQVGEGVQAFTTGLDLQRILEPFHAGF